jgi:hypothetical protein
MPRLLLVAVAAAWACATTGKNREALEAPGNQNRIFVGHSNDGELLVSTSHRDAMHGLVVPGSELGIRKPGDPDGDGGVFCSREMLTGTHVPQWICRYVREMEEDRHRAQIMLDNLHNTRSHYIL